MSGAPTARYLRNLLTRVKRFADGDGWLLQRQVESTASRRCTGVPVEQFFPSTGWKPGVSLAKSERRKIARICAARPVTDLCLAGALLRGEEFGSWGGVAEPDYKHLRDAWNRFHRDHVRRAAQAVA